MRFEQSCQRHLLGKVQKFLLLILTICSILLVAGCKQSIEILEINEADATSVFDLLKEEGEEVPNPNQE